MKRNDLEILSPAGDLPSLICAVDNGADAVYLGGKRFGARKNAKNFSLDDIKAGVEYAHLSGAKVYVTVNTLVFDHEIEELFEFLKDIYLSGVDGIIVQDTAILTLAGKYFPFMRLHASTQMTAHSLDCVNTLYDIGFERVVISRELSLAEIENICKNTSAEIEMFIHGALCVCYSGQCLMSSIIGQRSGNRGECAQPCRLPFKFGDYSGNVSREASYIFSLKDLCLAKKFDKIKDIGVKSLKIEGRMKNTQYVSFVTDMYSMLKKGGQLTESIYRDAETIFSRSGFTTGYFDDNKGPHMVNISSNNDDVYKNIPKELLDKCSSLGEKKRKPIYAHIRAKVGDRLYLKMWTEDGYQSETLLESKVSVANNAPLTYDKIFSSLSKLGDSFFYLESLEADFDSNAFVPVKDINFLRRECVDKIQNQILKIDRIEPPVSFRYKTKRNSPKKAELRAKVMNREQFNRCLMTNEIKKIFVEYELFDKDREYYLSHGDKVVVCLPVVIRDKFIKKVNLDGVKNVSISNIGHISFCKGKTIYGDEGLNITNSLACAFYKKSGLSSVMLSPELNLNQLQYINSSVKTEVIAYGRLTVMTSENCLIKTNYGKCACKEGMFYSVTDRKEMVFPVLSRPFNCTCTVYNSSPVCMSDRMDEIDKTGVDAIRLVFTDEDKDTVDRIISMYIQRQKPSFDYTRGHFYRGVLGHEKNKNI